MALNCSDMSGNKGLVKVVAPPGPQSVAGEPRVLLLAVGTELVATLFSSLLLLEGGTVDTSASSGSPPRFLVAGSGAPESLLTELGGLAAE